MLARSTARHPQSCSNREPFARGIFCVCVFFALSRVGPCGRQLAVLVKNFTTHKSAFVPPPPLPPPPPVAVDGFEAWHDRTLSTRGTGLHSTNRDEPAYTSRNATRAHTQLSRSYTASSSGGILYTLTTPSRLTKSPPRRTAPSTPVPLTALTMSAPSNREDKVSTATQMSISTHAPINWPTCPCHTTACERGDPVACPSPDPHPHSAPDL